MLNVADLSFLLTVLWGTLLAATGSASAGAPWWGSLLFAIMGMALGFVLGAWVNKVEYWFLNRSRLWASVAYMTFPFLAMAGIALVFIPVARLAAKALWPSLDLPPALPVL